MPARTTRCLITIDTECSRGGWPWEPGGEPVGYSAMMFGRTAAGEEYGVRYIMGVLEEHGLVGEFFVEPLCSYRLGLPPLRDICQEIIGRGHGVSLHLHPGWKAGLTTPPTRYSDMMSRYDLAGQESLLREGMELLLKCGVPEIVAFRAGNLGGDAETYEALRRVGIPMSSNYCAAWPREMRELYQLPPTVNDVRHCRGVWEFPVTSFRDFPRLCRSHLRPLQIAACSGAELQMVIRDTAANGLTAVVVLLHSFELIKRGEFGWVPDRRNIKRFLSMCEVLASEKRAFSTSRFSDIGSQELKEFEVQPASPPHYVPRGSDLSGARRCVVHAVAKLASRNRNQGGVSGA